MKLASSPARNCSITTRACPGVVLHAELVVLRAQHPVDRFVGLGQGRRDHHPLARGQPVGLDDDRRALRIDMRVCRGRVGEGGEGSRRDLVTLHERLGEGLGALELRGRLGRARKPAGRAPGTRRPVRPRGGPPAPPRSRSPSPPGRNRRARRGRSAPRWSASGRPRCPRCRARRTRSAPWATGQVSRRAHARDRLPPMTRTFIPIFLRCGRAPARRPGPRSCRAVFACAGRLRRSAGRYFRRAS